MSLSTKLLQALSSNKSKIIFEQQLFYYGCHFADSRITIYKICILFSLTSGFIDPKSDDHKGKNKVDIQKSDVHKDEGKVDFSFNGCQILMLTKKYAPIVLLYDF